MKRKNQHGQVLLLASFIALLLVLAVPVIIYLNQVGASHQNSSQKKNKGIAIAEEGVSHALRDLESTATAAQWDAMVVGGAMNPPFDNCNTGALITPTTGGQYKMGCELTSPDRSPYQLGLIVTGYVPSSSPGGAPQPTAAMEAFVSRKTLSATLPNANVVAGALMLANVPVGITSNDTLRVHWGPILCWYMNTSVTAWTLYDPLDIHNGQRGYPRKFANGPITGNTGNVRAPNVNVDTLSDQREYWAYASLTDTPVLDLPGYKADANDTGSGNTCIFGVGSDVECCDINTGVCDAGMGSCSATSASSCDLTAPAGFRISIHPTGVRTIYVNGDALFDNKTFIGANNSALLVTGNLTVSNISVGTGSPISSLYVPKDAAREYSYIISAGLAWPCSGAAGGTCPSDGTMGPTNAGVGNIHFRGFLYVGRTLTVNSQWNTVGAIQVGDLNETPLPQGQLVIPAGGRLTLMYDDRIQRLVKTQRYELQVDTLRGTNPR